MTSNYIPMGSDGSSLNNIDINVLNTHFLNENGDDMRGTLGMNNYQIKNVGEGIDEKDVINKKQLESVQSSLKTDILESVQSSERSSDNIKKDLNQVRIDVKQTITNTVQQVEMIKQEVTSSLESNKTAMVKNEEYLHQVKQEVTGVVSHVKKQQVDFENKNIELSKNIQNFKTEITSDKHFDDYFNKYVSRYEKYKQDKRFKKISDKYYKFEGKKDYRLDFVTLVKNRNDVKYNHEEKYLYLYNQGIRVGYIIEKDFTFFLVYKIKKFGRRTMTLPGKREVPLPIISGKNDQLSNFCGFDYNIIINDKMIYEPEPPKEYGEIQISVLMSLGGKMVIYFNQDLLIKTFTIKEGFEWGKLNIQTYGELFLYDFIVYNKRLMQEDIKELINTLAKYHNVPQKIKNVTDRLDYLEEIMKVNEIKK